MAKRIASALIIVETKEGVNILNQTLSDFSAVIIGRQGIPLRDYGISVISLVLEGTTDQINALAGKLGNIPGVSTKTVFSKIELSTDIE